MSETPVTPTVGERAADRYRVAHAAVYAMHIDLAILAEEAIHALHRQADTSYSDFLASLDTQGRENLATSRPVNTWQIPGTQFYLPDWKQNRRVDFFDPSFEQKLAEETSSGGCRIISFGTFVRECNELEYVAVCKGLHELASQAEHGPSDGLDND